MYCRPTIIFPRHPWEGVLSANHYIPTTSLIRCIVGQPLYSHDGRKNRLLHLAKRARHFVRCAHFSKKEGQDISVVPLRRAEIFKIRIFKTENIFSKKNLPENIFDIFHFHIRFHLLCIHICYKCIGSLRHHHNIYIYNTRHMHNKHITYNDIKRKKSTNIKNLNIFKGKVYIYPNILWILDLMNFFLFFILYLTFCFVLLSGSILLLLVCTSSQP